MNNSKSVNTNQFTGMNKDYNQSLLKDNLVTHARNATIAQNGDMVFYQTEASPELCVNLNYDLIGSCILPDNTYLLFSTDNFTSEIGIFNHQLCSYTKLISNTWFNFNTKNLITAVSKENADGSFSVYWADGRRNPDRVLNLSQVNDATSDNTRLSKYITPPRIKVKQSNNGVLPDGTYQAVIAYSINNVKFTDYYNPTIPVPIIDKDGGGGLEIEVEANDTDFKEFELVVIQSKESTSIAKRIGFYPSITKNITISNFDRIEYSIIPVGDIVITNPPIIASDQIDSNNQYLFRIGTEEVPEINYQQLAFNITSQYVVLQAPENYYMYGDKVGNYRDEVYSYKLQWLHKTGYYSSLFHIPGRKAKSNEISSASGEDVYERYVKDCNGPEDVKVFHVRNTAGQMIKTNNVINDVCREVEIGYGEMAYWESSDLYPNNVFQFGDQANKPIRHHKFPDESIVPRYSIVDGKKYINILGIRFSNIPHPRKEDGSLDTDWVGYRIIREDREGNRSVVSRGIATNMRSYTNILDGRETKEVHYSNYGVNFLGNDPFLSSTQTSFKNKKEKDYTPLSKFHEDKFTFYSPHNNIGRYSPTSELKFETEEIASIQGSFVKTYKHPKLTLLTQFSFWFAMALGVVETTLEATGSKDTAYKQDLSPIGPVIGTTVSPSTTLSVAGTSIGNLIKATFSGDVSVARTIGNIFIIIANLALMGFIFSFTALRYASSVLDIIYDFLDPIDYVYQYNSKASFVSQQSIDEGQKRRFVTTSNYLLNGIQEIDGLTINNFNRADSVFLQTNLPVNRTKNEDTSLVEYKDGEISSKGVAYYATMKINIPNQYGRIESGIRHIATHNNYFDATSDNYETPTLYGGDCWINKFAIKNPFLFFTQDLAFPFNVDNIGFNYRLYRNIAYPRYWLDSFKYDFSSLLNRTVVNRTQFTRTTTAKYNLDGIEDDSSNKYRVDNARMYTSYNTVLEFFVESDYNLDAREEPKDDSTFYKDGVSTNLYDIFKPEKLRIPEKFIYDKSFSKQCIEVFGQQQRTDYDPSIYSTVYKYSKNRLAYSLPSFKEQVYDNWQYFLSNNRYEFPRSEFGNLTSVHRVDGEKLMFLFDASSPYITLGRQQLETKDGTSIQIGDGGLFAQPPRELMYTEDNYGSSQSRFASVSTHFGTAYVGERQGRMYNFSGQLEETTTNGLYYWAKKYFPLKLTSHFPNYDNFDNPVSGCGYFMSFDSIERMIYLSKRDYIPKINGIEYKDGKFIYQGYEVSLKDDYYFEDVSFTLSYSPIIKQYVSFHDWNPDWVISTDTRLFTSKDRKIYRHNTNCLDFCTYYGKKRPFEIEYVDSNKFKTKVLSYIFYYLECFKYYGDCENRYLIEKENFDYAILWNNNQVSGLLELVQTPENPYESINYPQLTSLGRKILFDKVENQYRFNDIQDLYSKGPIPPVIVKGNGYDLVINPKALNFETHPLEREDFRYYDTKIRLIKSNPTSKMIMKITAQEGIDSPR